MERYRDISPRAFRQITISEIAEDLGTIFAITPALQVPNLFILAGRAVGMLNGLCSQLDPDLNIIELAQPHAKKFAAKPGLREEIFSKGKEIVKALLSLPEALQSVLDLAHDGGVRTHMRSEEMEGAINKIYKLAYRTLFGGIAALALLGMNLTPHLDRTSREGLVAGAAFAISSIAFLASFLKK